LSSSKVQLKPAKFCVSPRSGLLDELIEKNGGGGQNRTDE
jgi:hypothetical protein